MSRVLSAILFLVAACAQELSQKELDSVLAANDECASDGGEPCGVEMLQSRATKDVKAERAISAQDVIVEGGEEYPEYNATANATVGSSSQHPHCKAEYEPCFSDHECCLQKCGVFLNWDPYGNRCGAISH
mmetsp:Transcript_43281/g.116366  ORF Transcript_43281/g.116366 Transcript_43281/m.116366 type:complete len:131 (-) Transcript_43281:142-534(-)